MTRGCSKVRIFLPRQHRIHTRDFRYNEPGIPILILAASECSACHPFFPRKLYIPLTRPDAVLRPRLTEKLRSGLSRPGSFCLAFRPGRLWQDHSAE